MLQGTSESAVWKICQQGFRVVGTTDDGFYGAGVTSPPSSGTPHNTPGLVLMGTNHFL